ncbi:hypothetical protein [Sorangium sp. So ce362]|uniref:hypothetical protein n=1 Tax=Sorangium sp. So ce362 TaxID=3133303 RepID=UPI003F621EA5
MVAVMAVVAAVVPAVVPAVVAAVVPAVVATVVPAVVPAVVAAVAVMMAGPAGARVRRAGYTRLLDERKVLNRRGAGRTSERSDRNHRGGHQSADQSQLFHFRFLPFYPSMLTVAYRVMQGDHARCAPGCGSSAIHRQMQLYEGENEQDTAKRLGSIDGSGIDAVGERLREYARTCSNAQRGLRLLSPPDRDEACSSPRAR